MKAVPHIFYGVKPAFKTESVNVERPPIPLKNKPKENTEYALGDLHASTLKLIYFWAKIGLIQISDDDYRGFCAYYLSLFQTLHHSPSKFINLSKQEVQNFILAFETNITMISRLSEKDTDNIFSLLMGDTIYDRGCLDLLTLFAGCAVMQKHEHDGIQRDKVLISNHDMRFIEVIERDLRFDNNEVAFNRDSIRSGMVLQKLIDAGLISRSQIVEKFRFWAKHYEAIHYTVDAAGHLTGMFSHAPMNLQSVVEMASGLVWYAGDESNASLFPRHIKDKLIDAYTWFQRAKHLNNIQSKHMIALMDAINDLAKDGIKNNRFHKLADLGFESLRKSGDDISTYQVSNGLAGTFFKFPFYLLGWNRQHVTKEDVVLTDLPPNTYPQYTNGHHLELCHVSPESVHILDNNLCKLHDGQTEHQKKYLDCGPQGDLTWTETPLHPVPKPDVPSTSAPTRTTLSFASTHQRSMAGAAAALFCNVIALTVASVVKDDALGFLGAKTFDDNLGIALSMTFASAALGYGIIHIMMTRPQAILMRTSSTP